MAAVGPSGYTLYVKIDSAELDRQRKQWEQMFNNAAKHLGGGGGGATGGVGGGGGIAGAVGGVSRTFSSVNSSGGMKMMQMMGTLSGNPLIGQMGKLGGTMQKMSGMMSGMSVAMKALPVIGTTLGLILALAYESSPMLKSMVKLFNTSIMLIFRPIGDFIAMLLRPVMVMFLDKFIIPYYRYFDPFARKLGGQLGKDLEGFFKDPLGSLGKILTDILPTIFTNFIPQLVDGAKSLGELLYKDLIDSWNKIYNWFVGVGNAIKDHLQKAWDDTYNFFKKIYDDIVARLKPYWDGFVKWLTDVYNDVVKKLTDAWNSTVKWFGDVYNDIVVKLKAGWKYISDWFQGVGATIQTFLVDAWNRIVQFFASLYSDIKTVLTDAWNKLVYFFGVAKGAIYGTLQPAWDALSKLFDTIKTDITNTLSKAWDDIKGLGSTIYDDLSKVGGAIVDGYNAIKNYIKSIPVVGPTIASQLPDVATTPTPSPTPSSPSAVPAASSPPKVINSASSSNAYLQPGARSPTQKTAHFDTDRNSPTYGEIIMSASGGMVSEPVLGFGLRSGRRYSFGEQGSEMVMPSGGGASGRVGGGGSSIIVNVNIGNVSNGVDINRIVAAVKQALLQTNNRTGLIA